MHSYLLHMPPSLSLTSIYVSVIYLCGLRKSMRRTQTNASLEAANPTAVYMIQYLEMVYPRGLIRVFQILTKSI